LINRRTDSSSALIRSTTGDSTPAGGPVPVVRSAAKRLFVTGALFAVVGVALLVWGVTMV
jgi:hypothetical protein